MSEKISRHDSGGGGGHRLHNTQSMGRRETKEGSSEEERRSSRRWRVDHFGSVGGGGARLIDATAAPLRAKGRRRSVVEEKGQRVAFVDGREPPFYRMSASSVSLRFPPSDRCTRTNRSARVGLRCWTPCIPLQVFHHREFSDRGCFDATRHDATRALSLPPSSNYPFLVSTSSTSVLSLCRSRTPSLAGSVLAWRPCGVQVIRLVRIQPSLRLSLSACWSGWRAAALPRGGRTLCPAVSSTRCASFSFFYSSADPFRGHAFLRPRCSGCVSCGRPSSERRANNQILTGCQFFCTRIFFLVFIPACFARSLMHGIVSIVPGITIRRSCRRKILCAKWLDTFPLWACCLDVRSPLMFRSQGRDDESVRDCAGRNNSSEMSFRSRGWMVGGDTGLYLDDCASLWESGEYLVTNVTVYLLQPFLLISFLQGRSFHRLR